MLSRRDFLKRAALAAGALAFRSLPNFGLFEFPQNDKLGRVTVGKMDVFLRPDANSQILGALYEDQVVPWIREAVGSMPGRINQRFVETPMVSSGADRFNQFGINRIFPLRVCHLKALGRACGSKSQSHMWI